MNFPQLRRPLARGASTCHVLAVQENTGTMVAACGVACGRFCGDQFFDYDQVRCAFHGGGICGECLEVLERERQTGEWAGVRPDPLYRYSVTVCSQGGCPETVISGDCWCDEHLRVCADGCSHPAHTCEDASHFYEKHGGPPLPSR